MSPAGTALVARLDSTGDVLTTGPAVRAVAAAHDRVVFLAGPRGRAAAELLPGVDEILEWQSPWVDFDSPPVTASHVETLVKHLVDIGAERAFIFTSFHQSALPLALLFRMAAIPWIAAISDDYPGTLLDVRHRDPGEVSEPVRALSLAHAAGYRLPDGDDGRLQVKRKLLPHNVIRGIGPGRYVVFHPGAAEPARQPVAAHSAELVAALAAAGHRVVVTGGSAERELTAAVAGDCAVDLGGCTSLAELAGVLAGAAVVVAPNTGPAHLAAAVGTPVVSLFAPVVPAERWMPYGVPVALLGDQRAACRQSRARVCPVKGHPCLSGIAAADVVAAVGKLSMRGGRR